MKRIRCTIKKNGEIQVETLEGFAGSNCQTTLDEIMVGYGKATKEGATDDAYKDPTPDQFLNIQN